MTDNKNTILAIALSALVLIAWQYFFAGPQQKVRQEQLQAQQQQQQKQATEPVQPAQPAAPAAPKMTGLQTSCSATEGAGNRVAIDTDSLKGSISLKGGCIDELSLVKYHETIDPHSPPIVLLSPPGKEQAFFVESGWTGANVKVPDADTVWHQEGSGALTPTAPVTLSWDNGAGLTFRRTISVDDKYLFTIKDEVTNNGQAAVKLTPYAQVSRFGTPQTAGYYILHEGMIGYVDGLQEWTYAKMEEKKALTFTPTTAAWLGFTDKYWAAVLAPPNDAHVDAGFSTGQFGSQKAYQTGYLLDARTVAPGTTTSATARLFAGAKEVHVVNDYEKSLNLNRFDLLIDWGWFYFITKPLFIVIDWFYRLVGNFGLAILIVTVLIKAAFFPLANKSYASMAKMKAVQPQMAALKERFPDDKVKQQQALMELYKKEKINPLAGCLPIAIQIPVFFSLYKVLFVTIEMRHAPFFGWIHDLSSPDPTNLFTLFGLLHYDPTVVPVVGHFLHLGLWPLIMGVTMWAQMKLNPAPPDPAQAMIFNWMPVIFTFMLAGFPAGLVIYWAWNNSLSVAQQSIIMRKHGAKIELFDNVKKLFSGRPKSSGKAPTK